MDGEVTWIHSDHLHSATILTGAGGVEIRRLAYAAFGEELENTGTGDEAKYSYTGKELDSSGLMYYGARYYDPALARFITADTVYDAGPQGLNRYSYALNNPIRYRDPSGHSAIPSFFWESLPGQQLAGELQAVEQTVETALDTSGALVETTAASCAGSPLDCAQGALDIAGMHPAYGNIADAINAGISVVRGKLKDAGGRALAAIPIFGIAVMGKRLSKQAKNAKKVLDHVDEALEYSDELAEGVSKKLTGNNWKFNPTKDLDLRGSGATYRDALDEAFKRTGVPKDQFEVTKWGKDINGKSIPTEWTGPNGASVNMDIPQWNNVKNNGMLGEGPHQPHVGYQTPGKGKDRIRGHIFTDDIPATRR